MNDFLQTFFFQVRLRGFKHASLKQTTVNRKELPALSGNYDRQTNGIIRKGITSNNYI